MRNDQIEIQAGKPGERVQPGNPGLPKVPHCGRAGAGGPDARAWLRDSLVPAKTRESLHELNRRFLDLVATQPGSWNAARGGLPAAIFDRVAPLTVAQKRAAADCPYALFDLRFEDELHWQERVRAAVHGAVAEEPSVDARTMEFVRLAVFFAWHVAAGAGFAAQLVLGMNAATVASFRSATIDCLPALAAAESGSLTTRWNHCVGYWSALIEAAAQPDVAALRRVQLCGLQLAAAARLM